MHNFKPFTGGSPFTYNRGGQLIFDWDRLENFLLTRDRPVIKSQAENVIKCNKQEY